MITKKFVGPAQCVSCEKGITNLLGEKAEYINWKKLPFREPNERIARYGQGFSRVLAMMNNQVDGPSHFSNHRNTVDASSTAINTNHMYLSDTEDQSLV